MASKKKKNKVKTKVKKASKKTLSAKLNKKVKSTPKRVLKTKNKPKGSVKAKPKVKSLKPTGRKAKVTGQKGKRLAKQLESLTNSLTMEIATLVLVPDLLNQEVIESVMNTYLSKVTQVLTANGYLQIEGTCAGAPSPLALAKAQEGEAQILNAAPVQANIVNSAS